MDLLLGVWLRVFLTCGLNLVQPGKSTSQQSQPSLSIRFALYTLYTSCVGIGLGADHILNCHYGLTIWLCPSCLLLRGSKQKDLYHLTASQR